MANSRRTNNPRSNSRRHYASQHFGSPRLPAAVVAFAATSSSALAQKKYDTGATDTEIKIGNIMPYSGPASAYGVIGKTEEAYFKMINDKGGINGRKIKFVTYDDAYSPPKAVEQVRKLVESDEVLVVFNPLGTPSNTAIQKYLNAKKVPQLFVATGATKWNDPKNFPWTMGWQPSYQSEGAHLRQIPAEGEARRQDRGALSERRFRQGLSQGPQGRPRRQGRRMIVAEESYEISEPTVDSHIVKLKATGADVFDQHHDAEIRARRPSRRSAEIGWKPLQIVTNVSASVGSVMQAGRLRECAGHALGRLRQGRRRSAVERRSRHEEMGRIPRQVLSRTPTSPTARWSTATAPRRRWSKVLEMCGDDLTRANVMKQAASLKDFAPDTLLPGVKINTSPTDFAPIEQLQMMRFKGEKWELFGDDHQRRSSAIN